MTRLDVRAAVVSHSLDTYPRHAPTVRRLTGARLEADDGSVWLDAATGGFGSGHRGVGAAIVAQLDRIALSSRFLISRQLGDAVLAIDRLCPDELAVSYLCSSGAEAIDAALKLAKGTHPTRGRVLGIAGEDYGTFTHGLALGGRATPLPKLALEPISVPASDPDQILHRVDRTIAAVVLAPAAPGRTLAALPLPWWSELEERCRRTGARLILDERTTGPARTGTLLAVSQLGITPDVLILGETLGADAVPVGVAVMTREAYDRVYSRRNPTLHGSTFGANPLAAMTVAAVLGVADNALADRQLVTARLARRELSKMVGPDRPLTAFGADGSLVWLATATPALAHTLVESLAHERVLVRRPCGVVVPVIPPLTAERDDVEELFVRTARAARRLQQPEGIAA